jgi:hypothetical protein
LKTTSTKRKLEDGVSPSQNGSASSKKAKSSSEGYIQSPKFWYEYGDVILIVERMLFKLHGHTLALQSKYMARLLDGPAVVTLPTFTDGLLGYEVRDTNVDDFEVLLAALDSTTLVYAFCTLGTSKFFHVILLERISSRTLRLMPSHHFCVFPPCSNFRNSEPSLSTV